MHKATTRTVAAAAAVLSISVAGAAPAAAAPGDVTHSVTTAGDVITDTFANNSNQRIECRYSAVRAPFRLTGANDYAFSVYYSVEPGESESRTYSNANYAKFGDRLFIEWACYTTDYHEAWGTQLVKTLDTPTATRYTPTAQTATLIVGMGVIPNPPTRNCTGSICLPADLGRPGER